MTQSDNETGRFICQHTSSRVLEERAGSGHVARNPDWQDPRALGGVYLRDVCDGCGRERNRLANGPHEEIGSWGPSPEQIADADLYRGRDAQRRYRDALAARPGALELTSAAGAVAEARIGDDGCILVEGDGDIPTAADIAQIDPEWFAAAEDLRVAYSGVYPVRRPARGVAPRQFRPPRITRDPTAR